MNSTRIAAAGGLMVALMLVLGSSRGVRAGELSSDDQAFFDKHSNDIVHVEPTRVTDPAVVKVFAIPFYQVKIVMKMGDGDQTMDMVAARDGDKLVGVSRPSTDADMPDFPRTINPSFKLKNDAAAKEMQKALDALYPIIGDDDKKAEAFKHSGKQWTFIRGKFFDHHMGFVFETDATGTIKSAKYSLKLP